MGGMGGGGGGEKAHKWGIVAQVEDGARGSTL